MYQIMMPNGKWISVESLPTCPESIPLLERSTDVLKATLARHDHATTGLNATPIDMRNHAWRSLDRDRTAIRAELRRRKSQ